MSETRDNLPAPTVHDASCEAATHACPACGAPARRAAARFCSTCGRDLTESSYRPADTLRASYRWPEASALEPARTPVALAPRATGATAASSRVRVLLRRGAGRRASDRAGATRPPADPARYRNAATEEACVFVAYALIPCVGLLCAPCAVVYACLGLRRAARAPRRAGMRAAWHVLAHGVLVFGAQVLLWWALLAAPDWLSL